MRLTSVTKVIKLNTMASQFKPKRLRLCQNADKSYFESYADITVHEEMLGDDVRTNAYKKAIFDLKHLIKDKVVLDVGAGTGILSCFCAQAGARKVYAIEASNIAEQAEKVVISNGLENQVDVIEGLLEDVTLPENVDVIVSEWMGYCLLYESMLTSVITARDRWLKPGGILIPNTAALYVAPICDDEVMVEKVNFWNDMDEVYGVDMSCLLPFARKSLSKEVMVKSISCENILSQPQLIRHFNLNKVTSDEIEDVKVNFQFSSFGIADFQGFAIWFDVGFPSPSPNFNDQVKKADTKTHFTNNVNTCLNFNNDLPLQNQNRSNHDQDKKESTPRDEHASVLIRPLDSGVVNGQPHVLSTSPYKQETHWKQSLLYLDNEIAVVQDSLISGSVSLSPCSDNRRFLNIALVCQVDNGNAVKKNYLMGYELPNNKDHSK